MKQKRHAKILELIAQYPIDTQEELLRRLNHEGFNVTQATISRDIKELRLFKTLSEDGKYHYTTTRPEQASDLKGKYRSIFEESVQKVDYAGHMVVIKCFVGMAQAAGAALDSMHWPSIVGTLAGDDTVFILMRNESDAKEFVVELRTSFLKN